MPAMAPEERLESLEPPLFAAPAVAVDDEEEEGVLVAELEGVAAVVV